MTTITTENQSKLSFKQYLILASLLFGLFFGAGNLIFPIHLGQIAGHNWLPAAIGFLLSAILLPLFAILALSITQSNSMYDLALPAGKFFAIGFLVLTHASLGLLIAAPRTATVTFSMGVQPFIPKAWATPALLIFSLFFFALTFWLAYHEGSVTKNVGKVLNPIFILLMVFLFVVAFLLYGDIRGLPLMPKSGQGTGSLINGFLQGYNTMDALAGLGFGVTIITALKAFGQSSRDRSWSVAKVGGLTMGFEALIYTFLIALGAASLSFTKASADGGTAFTIIMRHYTGIMGAGVLAALTFLACLTTAIGLLTSLAQDLSRQLPKIGYHKILLTATTIAFLIANFGLEKIIEYSAPLLSFLYPLAITLILLGLLKPLLGMKTLIYRVTTGIVLIPALLDFIHTLPKPLLSWAPLTTIDQWALHTIPLYQVGLDFVPFLIIGLILSLLLNYGKKALTN
ncbi:branched-chain amino acid transport system II carrier protein [Fructilactobacillus cliffordii]|uniref:Branched-chain amino acid transport system carrier protein n=1 Tax=Fructilactobacillus cliffordii TaxID=2940299 RepID=A0A9Q8ZYH0_9LACO|nr:branched-chain amino acid transport system II carrier protein [Fructilactobacillus cliffordii]USS89866.1 branched-chain amino acid transport system II carrier protein [Fructilactobacillus cliffordii]